MVRKKQRRDELLLQKIVLRIKELRSIHGHTQEKLKEATGLNIPNLETGENFPNLTTLSIICSYSAVFFVIPSEAAGVVEESRRSDEREPLRSALAEVRHRRDVSTSGLRPSARHDSYLLLIIVLSSRNFRTILFYCRNLAIFVDKLLSP